MNTADGLTEILKLSTDQNDANDELLGGPGEPRQGSLDSDENLIELVKALYPRKPYCLVEEWTIFRAEVTE
ncbi:hypothetical protein DBR45_49680, partial [Pseudomonas sp. HMWF031]